MGMVCLLWWFVPAFSWMAGMPAGGEAFLPAAEAAVTVKPTPQLPQVIVRENFIQQAVKCIDEIMADNG